MMSAYHQRNMARIENGDIENQRDDDKVAMMKGKIIGVISAPCIDINDQRNEKYVA